MSKHPYALRDFLRYTPNVLLDRYFHGRNLLTDLDIASLPETEVDLILQAIDQLAPSVRATVESDFHSIHEVADEPGTLAILEAARSSGVDLREGFSGLQGFHDKVLATFLEHHEVFSMAARFREADELMPRYWVRRTVPAAIPRDDAAAREDLAGTLRIFFTQNELRGRSCVVEIDRRGPKYYYHAYSEDHGHTGLEFEGGQLQRRTRQPAFKVTFVYDPSTGSLDTHHEGKRDVIRNLQLIFGRVILVCELPDLNKDERVYYLNPFKHRDFHFILDPMLGIQDIRVRGLKLGVLGRQTRIIIEDDPTKDRLALYDSLDDFLDTQVGEPSGAAGAKVPLALTNVTKVTLQARFVPGGRKRSRTFYISYPNGCNLGHEGEDERIRLALVASGIEPQRQTSGQAAA